MLKITRKSSLNYCQSARTKSKESSSMAFPRKKIFSIIPSLRQAKDVVDGFEKRHKVMKQNRKKRLQETYNQNCRLYLSIKNQKSSYALPRKKSHKIPLEKICLNSSVNKKNFKVSYTPMDRYKHNLTQLSNRTPCMQGHSSNRLSKKYFTNLTQISQN